MANYLLVYHGGSTPDSPEEGAKVMQAWNDWYAKLGAAVVDGGNPASRTKVLSADGSVADGGPTSPTGYTIIKADDIDSAVELSRGCPIFRDGKAMVEVVETIEAM